MAIDLSAYPDSGPFDPAYVEAAIRDAYSARAGHIEEMVAAGWDSNPEAADGPNGEIYTTTPSEDTVGYWFIKIVGRVPPWTNSNPGISEVGPSAEGWSSSDGYYWEQRILYPWQSAGGGTGASTGDGVGADIPAVPLSTKAAKGITPQLGLLEDDILYNLSLLAVNVLEPLRQRYPNIIVISGFRQVNNGISQHERGEAADIQIRNQTPTLLFEVADYISKQLAFDQVILNYSGTDALSWIHVSFSAQTLRGEVLTRNYDDTFQHGLYLIEQVAGEDRAAAERERATFLTQIDTELSIMKSRDTKLNPSPVIGDGTVSTADSSVDGWDGSQMGIVPNEAGVVVDVFGSGEWLLADPASAGLFVEMVAFQLGGAWGLLKKSPGDVQYNGHSIDELAYKGLQANGKMVTPVKIVLDAGGYGARPGWEVGAPMYDAADWYAV